MRYDLQTIDHNYKQLLDLSIRGNQPASMQLAKRAKLILLMAAYNCNMAKAMFAINEALIAIFTLRALSLAS